MMRRLVFACIFLLCLSGNASAMAPRDAAFRANAKDTVEISGTITDFPGDESFVLNQSVTIFCDQDTVYQGVNSFEELLWGDDVEVSGTANGDMILATTVRLLTDPDPGLSFAATVDSILNEQSFLTTDGDTIITGFQTVFENFSGVFELVPGDTVYIEGNADNGKIFATLLRKISGSDETIVNQGTLIGFEDASSFILEDGTRVTADQGTLFDGFSTLDDLRSGDVVEVHWTGSASNPAGTIFLLDEAWEDTFSGNVDVVSSATRFVLADSTEVLIDVRTRLIGFDSLQNLEVGQTVEMTGAWWNDTFLAWSVEVQSSGEIMINGVVNTVSVAGGWFSLADGSLIRTTAETTYLGISGLADLHTGAGVRITGTWEGDAVIAIQVEVLNDPGDSQWVSGIVATVSDSGSFVLESGLSITTDAETELVGFNEISELQPGDLVEAMGILNENTLSASWVYLAEIAPEPVTLTADIAFLNEPDLIVLDDGTVVHITQETTWDGISSYDDLRAGDRIEIQGSWINDTWDSATWDFEAIAVRLLSSAGGENISRQGWVQSVLSSDSVQLSDGTRLDLLPEASFENFDTPMDLMPGDSLWIEGYTTSDPLVLDVTFLKLLQRQGVSIEFISEVVSVSIQNHVFSTSNGYEVLTNEFTVFSGCENLGDLRPGSTVGVTGQIGMDPEHPRQVLAQSVEVQDDGSGGGDDGGGLKTTVEGVVTGLVAPDRFIIDGKWTILSTGETLWQNQLEGYGDLVVGLALRCKASVGPGSLYTAIWVRNIGQLGENIENIEGEVLEIDLESARILLKSGERLVFDEYSIFDGDAAALNEVSVGMNLSASVVGLGKGSYLVLDALLSAPVDDVGSLGFNAGPSSEALVILHEGAVASEVAARHNATIGGALPGLLVFLFQWDSPVDLDALQILLDDEDVDFIEPNRIFSDPESDPEAIRRRAIAIDRSPTSDKFNDQNAIHAAKIAEAHQRNQGEGSIVAVLDTGIDPLHPLMRGRIASGGYDFVDHDPDPSESRNGIDDDNDLEIDEAAGHGTFVAGLVLLAAPAARILPFRVLNDDGRGTTFAICEAVLLAMDRGVDVINMSFSYNERSNVLDAILMEASKRGVVLVSGAGNAASTELPFPAVDNRVLAVSALNNEGITAFFSNYGEGISVAAPGVDLYSAGLDSQFGTWSGTSMAAPLVSGVVALLRSVNPRLNPEQVAEALSQGSTPGVDGAPVLDAAASLALVPTVP